MLERTFVVNINQDYSNKKIQYSNGYYWDKDNYFVTEPNALRLKKIIDIIYNTEPQKIKDGDVIYASKASETPRFKLKEFIKNNNLKKTSKHGHADYILISKGFMNDLKQLLKIEEFRFFKEAYVEEHFLSDTKHSWNAKHSWVSDKQVETFNNAIDKNRVVYVRPQNLNSEYVKSIFNILNNEYEKFQENTSAFFGMEVNCYRNTKLVEIINILCDNEKNILSGKTKFIFDEEFFENLNKEGIELDDEYLAILKDMLFSDDKSNIKLGFEMMSNLVISQPTLLSISFLLNELYHTTNFRPSKYTQSNTNLKGLLKILKTKGIRWDHNWKTFGTGLRLNFKEGKEGEIVKKFLLDNINREFRLNNDASEILVDIVFATETN
jgi:hypothetical protein